MTLKVSYNERILQPCIKDDDWHMIWGLQGSITYWVINIYFILNNV